jgi:uncharacterized Zn finger protein
MSVSEPIACPVCSGRSITEHHYGAHPTMRRECERCGFVWKPGRVTTTYFAPGDTTAPTITDSSVFRIIDE